MSISDEKIIQGKDICHYHLCRKRTQTSICDYCGDHFCKDHIEAKPVWAGDSGSSQANTGVPDTGHPCPPYHFRGERARMGVSQEQSIDKAGESLQTTPQNPISPNIAEPAEYPYFGLLKGVLFLDKHVYGQIKASSTPLVPLALLLASAYLGSITLAGLTSGDYSFRPADLISSMLLSFLAISVTYIAGIRFFNGRSAFSRFWKAAAYAQIPFIVIGSAALILAMVSGQGMIFLYGIIAGAIWTIPSTIQAIKTTQGISAVGAAANLIVGMIILAVAIYAVGVLLTNLTDVWPGIGEAGTG